MPARATFKYNEAGWRANLASKEMADAMYQLGDKVYDRHQVIANHDTGEYKAKSYVRVYLRDARQVARIGSTAAHSAFLEFGTRYMRRYRPYGRALDVLRN